MRLPAASPAMLLLLALPLSAQSAPASGSGGWTPPADHGEAVRQAHVDLAILDLLLEARPDDDWYRVQRLRTLHFLAVEEEAQLRQVDREAAGMLDRADRGEEASRAVARAYQGAAEVLRAKHALWPGTKNRHLRNGLAVLDSLVTRHPAEAEIRYLRLVSTAYLPFFFGRGASAEEDAAALALLLLSDPIAFPAPALAAMTGVLLETGRLDGGTGERVRRLREAVMETMPADRGAALGPPSRGLRDRLLASGFAEDPARSGPGSGGGR